MRVILADEGPLTQSESVTGGKLGLAVGPGVGFCVTTVQPESGPRADSTGMVSPAVGAGLILGVAVGGACRTGKQAESPTAISSNNMRYLRILFSMGRYL